MNHGNVLPAIANGMLVLHDRIAAAKLPPSKINESQNIVTWSVRDFSNASRTVAAVPTARTRCAERDALQNV